MFKLILIGLVLLYILSKSPRLAAFVVIVLLIAKFPLFFFLVVVAAIAYAMSGESTSET